MSIEKEIITMTDRKWTFPLYGTNALDHTESQIIDLNNFLMFALSHLTIEEFKEALTMAMQYKANNGGVKCITRPFEPSKPSIDIGSEVAKIMSEKSFEEVKETL